MKKKFILPRRLFAFALAFALTFTSFSPLSVYADGDEEQVQQTVTEEEHRDDCCDHEAEDAAAKAAAEEAERQAEQTPTETPVIEETLPQVEVTPEVKTEVPLVEEEQVMMLLGASGCKHPKGQTITTTIEPDCITAGYVEVYCNKCKSVVSHDVLPATGEHSYDNGVITTDPTCTKKGVKTFTCKVCKKTRTEDVGLLDHVSVEVPAKATSCTEEGMTAGHKCSVCGTILDGCQTIPMSNHNYEEVGEVKPTCTTDGHTAGTKCSVCGEVLSGCEVLEKTGHDFEAVEKSDPICGKEDGRIKYECRKCEYYYDELIEAKLIHDFEDIPEKEATCTEDGCSAYQKCKNCGYIPVQPTITPALGGEHSITLDKVLKAATCKEEGEGEYKCSKCGFVKTGVIPKTDHEYGEEYPVVTKQATCGKYGTEDIYKDCKYCGYKCLVFKNRVIYSTGDHKYSKDMVVIQEPTCTVYEYRARVCEVCGARKDITQFDKLGHKFENYIPNGDATCQSVGTMTATCSRDGCTETKTIAGTKLGDHVWENDYTVDKEPTCTEDGSKSIHCSLCDAKKEITPITKTGHNLEWVTIKEPTCTEKGSHKQVCKNDGCTYETEPSDMNELGHDWATNYTVDIEPTCLNYGWKSKHCSRCEAWTDQQRIEKNPHDYGFLYETEPNCELPGRKYYKCKGCEDSYSVRIADKLGHDFEWVTIKEATCTEDGSRKQVCKRKDCSAYTVPETIPATGHDFSIVKEVVKPTCLNDGYTVYKCSRCEETEVRDTVTKLGHQFGEWYVAEEATCQNAGLKRRDCTKCSHYETEVIPKEKNHKYVFSEKVAPTCTEQGYDLAFCKWCNKERRQHLVNPLGHDFSIVKEVVKSTCTEKGYTVYKCKWCDETEIRDYVDALDHDYEEEWKVIKEPTCKELGVKARYCKNEGCNNYLSSAINKVGHSFTEVKEVVKPTCTEKGYTVCKCKWCDETEIRDYVDPLNHDYDDWFIVTDPTCQKDGEERHNCKNCEAYETRPIAKLDHHVFSEFVKKVEPTCIDDGYTTYKCTWCEETENRDIVKTEGHKYGEWYTVTDPTCQAEGEARRDCKNCEHFETKPIDKVDHAYNKFVKAVAPTCESRGYSVYKCQWCEKTETRDYVDALGHKHVTDPGKSATCTSDGYTEKEYCSRCGKVFRERETTKATGHIWGPEQFENIVFPTTISVGGYDSVRYCWNCGCKHSVHVTLPMITLKPVAPIKPLPGVPTLPIPPKPPVKLAQPDDPMDIIDRSEEQKADDIAESPEDVKDKETVDSSKSEEVVDDKSNETSEQIVTDNGKDDQKKSKITSQDPKDNETGEDVDTDYSTYFIIAFGILLLIILITLFIILMSKRKNDEEDGELK